MPDRKPSSPFSNLHVPPVAHIDERVARLEASQEQVTANINRLTDDVRSLAQSVNTLAASNRKALDEQTTEIKAEIARDRERNTNDAKDRNKALPSIIVAVISLALTIIVVYINSAVGPVAVRLESHEQRLGDDDRDIRDVRAEQLRIFEMTIRHDERLRALESKR